MLDERTQARDLASGFFRGLAAAARGYVGAKVAVARARNERDLHKAQFALEGARLKLIQEKQNFEQQNAQSQRESEERMHAERMDVARFQIVTDNQGIMYKVDKETGSAVQIATIQADAQTAVAEGAEEGATERANIQAGAQRDVATTQAGAVTESAQISADASRDVATTQGEATTGAAQIQADASVAVEQIRKEIASQGYASQESVARIEALGKNMGFNFGGGVSMLNEDEWARLNDMMSKVSQNKDMTIIRHIKGGFVTAMQGFIDASQNGPMSQQAAVANSEEAQQFGFSMADMAIINGYQRMIDPGATVREGDVDALIASMAKSEQLRAFVNQYIGTGGRFTPEGRAALAELVLNQYNANIDARTPGLSGQLTDVLRASGLEGRGISMDFFDIPQREHRSIEQILQSGGEWAQGIGQEATQAQPPAQGTQPEGTVQSGQAPRAGDAGESELPLMGWAEDYKRGREQGLSDEQLDAALRNALTESGVPEAQIESTMAQIKARVDATGQGSAIGEMEQTVDETTRMAKVAAPSQVTVEDLNDPETYRALKVKFAPAGFLNYTEQEWNRYKGQAYQDMLDAGMPEDVAKALVAKMKAEIEGSADWASDVEE